MQKLLYRLKKIIDEKAGGKHTVFAKNAGISISTFQFNIDGRPPNVDTLFRIRKTYGVNLNWLLTGEGEPYVADSMVMGCNDDPETAELLEMARQVVQSNTAYSPSLKTNIRSSHQAMEAENRLQDLEERVRQIEDGSVMKREASGGGRSYDGPERRKGERRQNDDPGAIPGDKDRRSGTDRRVSG